MAALCGPAYKSWLAHEQIDCVPAASLEAPAVGLQNLGNMCFLNAVVQCLHFTPMLRRNLSLVSPAPHDEWLAALLQMFQELEESRHSRVPVTASRIAGLMLVASTTGEFQRGQQADAHEAFMLLVSKFLNGCLPDISNLSFSEKEHFERSSLIGHIFGMDYGQSVRCNSCHSESKSTRAEYCLVVSCTLGLTDQQFLELEQEASPKKTNRSYLPWRKGKETGLQDVTAPDTHIVELLGEYTRGEEIPEWKCERCSGAGCTRTAFVAQPPNILLIHVQRRQGAGLFSKIFRKVNFDMDLDLTPYLDPADESCTTNGPCRYSLYAVIVHRQLGTRSGHYVAYVRSSRQGEDQWYLMDDDKVVPVSWSEVQDEDPYLLAYESLRIVPPKDLPEELLQVQRLASASLPVSPTSVMGISGSASPRGAAAQVPQLAPVAAPKAKAPSSGKPRSRAKSRCKARASPAAAKQPGPLTDADSASVTSSTGCQNAEKKLPMMLTSPSLDSLPEPQPQQERIPLAMPSPGFEVEAQARAAEAEVVAEELLREEEEDRLRKAAEEQRLLELREQEEQARIAAERDAWIRREQEEAIAKAAAAAREEARRLALEQARMLAEREARLQAEAEGYARARLRAEALAREAEAQKREQARMRAEAEAQAKLQRRREIRSLRLGMFRCCRPGAVDYDDGDDPPTMRDDDYCFGV